MIRSYPIGTIIIWETYEKLPFSKILGSSANEDYDGPFRYVIDGQQRLMSLMLISNSWKIKRGEETIERTPISFDTSTGLHIGETGIDVSLLVNAAMAESWALKKLLSYKDYEKANDQVGKKISNYELPIYTLRTPGKAITDPEVIAEIFTRINRSGAKLGNLQMFLSFFASAFPELKESILAKYNELNNKYSDEYPSWEATIRTVFGNLGQNQNRITQIKSFKKVVNNIKKYYDGKEGEFKEIIERTFRCIDCGLALIKEELGISNQKFLPSQNVMVPIYKWLFENSLDFPNKIKLSDKNKVLKWFLIASTNNLFSSSTNKTLEETLKIMVKKQEFPLKDLLDDMETRKKTNTIDPTDIITGDANKSGYMLLLAYLRRNQASDWANHQILSSEVSIQHIFPRNILKERYEERVNELSNLTFMNINLNKELQDTPPEDYLKEYLLNEPKVLRDHLIPMDPKLWDLDNFEKFMDARDELVQNAINSLISSL